MEKNSMMQHPSSTTTPTTRTTVKQQEQHQWISSADTATTSQSSSSAAWIDIGQICSRYNQHPHQHHHHHHHHQDETFTVSTPEAITATVDTDDTLLSTRVMQNIRMAMSMIIDSPEGQENAAVCYGLSPSDRHELQLFLGMSAEMNSPEHYFHTDDLELLCGAGLMVELTMLSRTIIHCTRNATLGCGKRIDKLHKEKSVAVKRLDLWRKHNVRRKDSCCSRLRSALCRMNKINGIGTRNMNYTTSNFDQDLKSPTPTSPFYHPYYHHHSHQM